MQFTFYAFPGVAARFSMIVGRLQTMTTVAVPAWRRDQRGQAFDAVQFVEGSAPPPLDAHCYDFSVSLSETSDRPILSGVCGYQGDKSSGLGDSRARSPAPASAPPRASLECALTKAATRTAR